MNNKYKLLEEATLPEYRSQSYYYKHLKSGAHIYVVENDDEENLFCLGFKTPVSDDSGVAHILEHTVLCGSQKYPSKDPFVSLLKSSMQSFLNAMTYPDKTLYPAASAVEQDYFNLFSVYADAVFFPLLRKESLWQEGFRYQLNNDGSVSENGVVLNEMKGNYANMENFAYDELIKALFPTNCYKFDSGGNPDFIPDLTYEGLKAFHQRYYHPSNCSIFLYGNIDKEKKLNFLANYLDQFDEIKVDNQIELEKDFANIQTIFKNFAGDDVALATVSVGFRLGELPKDEVLALEVLMLILLGSSGSPLYMALQNSGLGQDISSITGLSLDYREVLFNATLREVAPENEAKVEPLVLNSLEQIVKEGVNTDEIESALRTIEYSRSEIRSGPYGLQLMGRLYKYWNHGLNPNKALAFKESMQNLRIKAFEQGFFENLIKKHLLKNSNRLTLIVKPDVNLYKERRAAKEQQLKTYAAGLTEQAKKYLREQDELLKIYQNLSDEGGIPILSRDDVPKLVSPTVYQLDSLAGLPLIITPCFTAGITYWRLAFNINELNEEELYYLPFFTHILSELGYDGVSYDEVSRKLALNCGDFAVGIESNGLWKEGGKVQSYLYLSFSALPSQLAVAAATVSELLTKVQFNSPKRLKDLFYELYNDLKQAIQPAGTYFVGLRLGSKNSPAMAIEERWQGLSQFFFLEKLSNQLDSEGFWPKIITIFQNLHHKIFVQKKLTINITASEDDMVKAKEILLPLVQALPEGQLGLPAVIPLNNEGNEGFAITSGVNYAGMIFPCSDYISKERRAEILLSHYLTTGALLHSIRAKGGAYGVTMGVSGIYNYAQITSYRDPRLKESLEDFAEALKLNSITEEEFTNTLISVIGKEVRPQAPKDKALAAFKRYLYKLDDETRQQARNQVLALTSTDLILAAERLYAGLQQQITVAIGSEEALKEAGCFGTIIKLVL
ncbi:MAG: insulinase family protein [Spirochaetaceae bacterium]|nr:insulinase family protein [Spirochaetaceae bacterium]